MTETNLVVSKTLSSRIPRLQRSSTFHNLKSPLRKENEHVSEGQDELGSLSSVCSGLSCGADWGYRKRATKYAFHCSTRSSLIDSSSNEYLTPTQRANRKIRELQFLLKESETSCRMKSYTVDRLSQELADCKLALKNTVSKQKGKKESRNENETNDECQSDNTLILTDSGLGWSDDFLSNLKDSDIVFPHQAAGSVEKQKLMSIHLQEIEKMKEDHSSEVG